MNYITMIKLIRNTALTIFMGCFITIFAGCASLIPADDVEKSVVEPKKLITDIKITENSESALLLIQGNRPLEYTSVKQISPMGVILYFPETSLGSIKDEYKPESPVIKSIKVVKFNEKNNNIKRIEILLKKDFNYYVKKENSSLEISFKKSSDSDRRIEAAKRDSSNRNSDIKEKITDKKRFPSATFLKSVQAKQLEKGVRIDVKADGMINDFKKFNIASPSRTVFDIFNIKSLYKNDKSIPVNSDCVKSIRYYSYPDRIRLVLNTKKIYLPTVSAYPEKEGLSIYVGTGKEKENNSTIKLVKADKNSPKENNIKPEEFAWIDRLDFLSEEAGRSTIIIGTTKPVKYKIKKSGSKKLLLNLLNTKLSDYRKRPLITTGFESAVDRITPSRTSSMKDSSVITIELRETVPYLVEQKDNLLMVHFDASSVAPKPFEQAGLLARKNVVSKGLSEPLETGVGSNADLKKIKKVRKTEKYETAGKYTGEKIALDFYETDIKNVFRIIRAVSKKNFAIDKNVKGKVTLSFENPVPWDQVLDLILKMNNLGKINEGEIIRIATIEDLKKEEDLKQAKLAAEEKTKKQQEALEPLITEYIPVNYANAKDEMLPHLENLITKGRGSLSVDERTNLIIITDTSGKIKKARNIVKKLDMVTPQVRIESRIVEANTDFSRSIGIDWGVAGNTGNNLTDGILGYDLAMNYPVASTSSIGFDFLRLGNTPFYLNARLTAMESMGDGKIISAPKILTLDNKEALIKQGVEVAYLERDDSGGATVKFKSIDLEMKVIPHITLDDRILLKISIVKNDLKTYVDNIPTLTTKEAKTELLINDGDTIVIGGIIKTNKFENINGFPFLSKVPVLGWLFKSNIKTREKQELLIFITPSIVRLDKFSLAKN